MRRYLSLLLLGITAGSFSMGCASKKETHIYTDRGVVRHEREVEVHHDHDHDHDHEIEVEIDDD